MSSNLELLPNEIILEIFKYTNAVDLCRGFHLLNRRIQAILYSVPLRVKLSVLANAELNVIVPYAEQIESLCITSSPTGFHGTPIISPVDLSRLVQLHSLTLLCDTDEQQARELCTQPFEHLTYLRLSSFTSRVLMGSYQSLMQRIFSNGFPALRVCHLPRATPPRNIDSPSSPSIRVISLKQSTFFILASIVACAPNATHVTVDDFNDGEPVPIRSKSLTHLKLGGGHELGFDTIQLILSNISKLKLLSIRKSQQYGQLDQLNRDLTILENIISTKLDDLQGFRCHIDLITYGFSNPIENSMQLLTTFPLLRNISCKILRSDQRPYNGIGVTLLC